MGAGQIGGIATLIDLDFHNAAGFHGVKAQYSEGQFVTYYLSHALLFCAGALIEPHVVLTPALCIFGERYKFDVFAGTHTFEKNRGITRVAEHVSVHKAYNHTHRWHDCSPHNIGMIVTGEPFSFHEMEPPAEYVLSRLRYGAKPLPLSDRKANCQYFGFGSRRNGFLVPLLIYMRKVKVVILPPERCLPMWKSQDNQFLCIEQVPCKTEKYGAMCPDDVGSVIECSGFAVGMMVSRLIDRPCGVGFLDLQQNLKFLTCGVDDASGVIAHESYLSYSENTLTSPADVSTSKEDVESPEVTTATTSSAAVPTETVDNTALRQRQQRAVRKSTTKRADTTSRAFKNEEKKSSLDNMKQLDYYGYL